MADEIKNRIDELLDKIEESVDAENREKAAEEKNKIKGLGESLPGYGFISPRLGSSPGADVIGNPAASYTLSLLEEGIIDKADDLLLQAEKARFDASVNQKKSGYHKEFLLVQKAIALLEPLRRKDITNEGLNETLYTAYIKAVECAIGLGNKNQARQYLNKAGTVPYETWLNDFETLDEVIRSR